MTIRRRNPFDDIEELLNRMSQQFESAEWPMKPSGSIAVDVEDAEDAFVVTADLPGYDKDDLELTIADDVLRIHAARDDETEETTGQYIRRERSHRELSRSVTLPKPVEETEVTAGFKNGVLTVTLPKTETTTGRAIDIE